MAARPHFAAASHARLGSLHSPLHASKSGGSRPRTLLNNWQCGQQPALQTGDPVAGRANLKDAAAVGGGQPSMQSTLQDQVAKQKLKVTLRMPQGQGQRPPKVEGSLPEAGTNYGGASASSDPVAQQSGAAATMGGDSDPAAGEGLAGRKQEGEPGANCTPAQEVSLVAFSRA